MTDASPDILLVDDDDVGEAQKPLEGLPTRLALPAPACGKKRRSLAPSGPKAEGPRIAAQNLQKARLLAWVARLRHLHSACSHPFLQAVVLSVWGSFRLVSPPLAELLERFSVTATHADTESPCSTPLLSACQAARRGQGTPTDLAVCFVALCRALDIPARLVLALDPGSTSSPSAGAGKEPGKTSSNAKSRRASMQSQSRCSLDGMHQRGSACSSAANKGVIEVDDDAHPLQQQLVSMGFSNDAALSALLQAEQEGSADVLSRATDLLLTYDAAGGAASASSSTPSQANAFQDSSSICPRCTRFQATGSFCGACGARMRAGGADGAADTLQEEEEEQPVVTAWPEAYDFETGRWVAVDVMFGDIVKDPRVEWVHRGVPMLWVCAADDGLRGASGHCILRDVTPRYSPSWWRVEQARGHRVVQRWWEEEALQKLSTWQPIHLALTDNSRGGSVVAQCAAAAEIAADADQRDVQALKARRMSDAMPTTKAGLKHHKRYASVADLSRHEVLKPGARPVNVVAGAAVYLRTDVARALTAPQWQKLGRRVKADEAPCKTVAAAKAVTERAKKRWGEGPCDLFGDWQTEIEDCLALPSLEESSRTRKQALPRSKIGFKKANAAAARKRMRGKTQDVAAELSLPALPAPKKLPKAKAKQGPGLAFRMPSFKAHLAKLQAWLDKFGFLPYERSSNAEERQLGLWISKAVDAYAKRRLSQQQIDMLEQVEQWEWGGVEGGAATGEPEDGGSKPAAAEHGPQRGQKRGRGKEQGSQAGGSATQSEDNSMEQWSQLTMQRLARQLTKQVDAAARRSCLRTWQRVYHPDKNPGRSDEVLPIFRWVQACWDRDFRAADAPSAAATKPAGPSDASKASATKASTAAQAASADSGGVSALAAPLRKRITGKRKA